MKKITVGSVVLAIVLTIVFTLSATGSASATLTGSGWWSSVNVQRVGNAAGSASVGMTVYAMQGTTGGPWDCGMRDLPTFGSGAVFYPFWTGDPAGSNCANAAGFPSSFAGSGVLSSSDQIVGFVNMMNISFGHWAPGATPYGRAFAAYGGISNPSLTIVFPLYKNNHGGEMDSFYIQNTTGSSANVTATFKPCADQGNAGHTPCLGYPNTYTYQFNGLDAYKTIVIDASLATDGGGNHMPAGNGSFGGLTVVGTQNLGGVVLEYNMTASPAMYLKAAQGAGTNDIAHTVYVPTIKYQYPGGPTSTNPNSSKWSGLMIHNADTGTASVTVTYTLAQRNASPTDPAVGTQFTQGPFDIAEGETSFTLFHNGLSPVAGTQPRDLLSATVVANKNISVLVNEEGDYSIAGQKDYTATTGIPLNQISTKLSAPGFKNQYNGKFTGVTVMNVGGTPAPITATLTVVGKGGGYTGSLNPGDTVKVQTVNNVQPGASVTFFMLCRTYSSPAVFQDMTGDTGQMADLCSGTGNPTGGTNASVVFESTQNLIAWGNEELLWYENPAARGDGQGEDASSFEAFPIIP